MSGKKSKTKGNAYERKTADQLGGWFYNDPKALARTRGSGLRAYTAQVEPGDIGIAKEGLERFPLAVECKDHKSWHLEKILTEKNLIFDAWEQLQSEIRACSMEDWKFPLIILKSHHSFSLCVFEYCLAKRLGVFCRNTPHLCFSGFSRVFFIMKFDDFLELDPVALKFLTSSD